MATVTEVSLVVATEACARETFVVHLTVVSDVTALAAANDIFAPVEEQFHVRRAHIFQRGYALFFVCWELEVGYASEIR
jgi:hypothetical protein